MHRWIHPYRETEFYSACVCSTCLVCVNKFSNFFLLLCNSLSSVISPTQILIAQRSTQHISVTSQCIVTNVRGKITRPLVQDEEQSMELLFRFFSISTKFSLFSPNFCTQMRHNLSCKRHTIWLQQMYASHLQYLLLRLAQICHNGNTFLFRVFLSGVESHVVIYTNRKQWIYSPGKH